MLLTVLFGLAASDQTECPASTNVKCTNLVICLGGGCPDDTHPLSCLTNCKVETDTPVPDISVQVANDGQTFSTSRPARYTISSYGTLPSYASLSVEFTGSVVIPYLASAVTLEPVGTWRVKELYFSASQPFSAPASQSARAALLVVDAVRVSSSQFINYAAFRVIRYADDSITPFTYEDEIEWIPVPAGANFPDEDENSAWPSATSFGIQAEGTITLTLTDAGLLISERGAGTSATTKTATVTDLFGFGFRINGVRPFGQTVTVTATTLSGRTTPRLRSPYLELSVQSPSGSSDATTTVTFAGPGWTGSGDVSVSTDSSYIGSYWSDYPELALNAAKLGIEIDTQGRDLEVSLGVAGVFIKEISAYHVWLTPASGASDVFIDTLSVSTLVSSNEKLKVIAGDVNSLALWNLDLTVRAELHLTTLGNVPQDSRHWHGQLTVSQSATIYLSDYGVTFWNSSSFPASRYYIHIDDLPSLDSLEARWQDYPGVYQGPGLYAYPIVCGVDCGKFEILINDADWGYGYAPQPAQQTCIKYSDYFKFGVSGSDPGLQCVALKPIASAPDSSVSLTYTEANTLRLSPYETSSNDITADTTDVWISGQSDPYDEWYNSFPIDVDFDATPIRKAHVELGNSNMPHETVTIKASPDRIEHLELDYYYYPNYDYEEEPKLAVNAASKPLTVKRLTVNGDWAFASPSDLDWAALERFDVPFSFYGSIPQAGHQTPRQIIRLINAADDLDDATLTLGARSVQLKEDGASKVAATFTAPSSGSFTQELIFSGLGYYYDREAESWKNDYVTLGTLILDGPGAAAGGQYILDFQSGHLTNAYYFELDFASGWGNPSNLLIRSPEYLTLDVSGSAAKTFNFALEFYEGSQATLTLKDTGSSAASGTVEFAGHVWARSVWISKPYETEVVLKEVTLESGSISVSGICEPEPGQTCKGLSISNLTLLGGTIPAHVKLTDHLTVSGSNIATQSSVDPDAFEVSSLSLDERSSLWFDGEVPAVPATVVVKLNFTSLGEPISQSLIVKRDFNGSFFHEFNRSEAYEFPYVCGAGFATTCQDWLSKIERAQITGDALGNGVSASVEFSCGTISDPDEYDLPYKIVFPDSGSYDGVKLEPEVECVLLKLGLRGGSATSAHYSSSEEDDDSGLGAGTSAAIALGVILLVVVVVVVLLLVLGKLAFSRGADADP